MVPTLGVLMVWEVCFRDDGVSMGWEVLVGEADNHKGLSLRLVCMMGEAHFADGGGVGGVGGMF